MPAAGELEIEWGAFTATRTSRDDWELTDAGTFVKTVWREGVLQGESGISFATEVGALVPGTPNDEDDVGAEAILIASTRIDRWTLHVNAGGGIERNGSNTFALAGLITDYPVSERFQLVGEMRGEKVAGENLEASLLVGTIMEPAGFDGEVDIGIRSGLTSEAADWAVTVGVTLTIQAF